MQRVNRTRTQTTDDMEPVQLRPYSAQQMPVGSIKESIRDMILLQRDYQISDELFWEIFNARVLLNEHVDVDTFLKDLAIEVARA